MLFLLLSGYVIYNIIQVFFDISDRRQRKADKNPISIYL